MKVVAILFLSASSLFLEKVASEWPTGLTLPFEYKVHEETWDYRKVYMKVRMPKIAVQSEQSLTMYFSKGQNLDANHKKIKITFNVTQHKLYIDQYIYKGSSQEPSYTREEGNFQDLRADSKNDDFVVFTLAAWSWWCRVIIWTSDIRTATTMSYWAGDQWPHLGITNAADPLEVDWIRFVRVEGKHVDLLHVHQKPSKKQPPVSMTTLKMVPGLRIFLSGQMESAVNVQQLTVLNLEQGGRGKNLLTASYHDKRNDEYDEIAQMWQWQQDATLQMMNPPNGTHYGALNSDDQDCLTWALEFFDAPGRGLIKVHLSGMLVGEVDEFDGYTFINGSATLLSYFKEIYTVAFFQKVGGDFVQVDPSTMERLFPARN